MITFPLVTSSFVLGRNAFDDIEYNVTIPRAESIGKDLSLCAHLADDSVRDAASAYRIQCVCAPHEKGLMEHPRTSFIQEFCSTSHVPHIFVRMGEVRPHTSKYASNALRIAYIRRNYFVVNVFVALTV